MGTGENITKQDMRYLLPLETRWSDNDQYGHLNNAVYYQLFDTAVNRFLLEHNLLDVQSGETIFVVVETGCRYFAEIAYPEQVIAGLTIAHLGTSSLRYNVALFAGTDEQAKAAGHFVHVNISRNSRKPSPIDTAKRAVFSQFMTG
jgi:acyl-CoA thioester hydrolase